VRLVGEDAWNGSAQPVAALLGVALVGQLDEPRGGLGVHGVHVRIAVVDGAAALGDHPEDKELLALGKARRLPAGDPPRIPACQTVQPACKHRRHVRRPLNLGSLANLHAQVLHPEARFRRHHAPCRAAGPAVLVVEPGLHAQPLGLVGAGVDEPEPFLAQVLGGQARARVHEEAAHAHAVEDADLAQKLRFLKAAIP